MNVKGFTLIEVLLAFTCISISMIVCIPIFSSLKALQKPSYLNEDRLAIYQIRMLLAQSNEIKTIKGSMHFQYQKKNQILEFDRNRLVRKEGYEIFMQHIDELNFEQKEDCFHVVWKRKNKQKRALLACNK